jgi:hypothetical protein
MTSTNHTTIATRIGQCLAATALMAGIAFGATPIVSAKPNWDGWGYSECLRQIPVELPWEEIDKRMKSCCEFYGGTWNPKPDGDSRPNCEAPLPEAENVPQPPTQTTTPPVLQNPPQTSNPLIPTPRGPNSGTLAP